MNTATRSSFTARALRVLLMLLGGTALLWVTLSAAGQLQRGEYVVTEKDGRFTVRANEAPVLELVRAIGEEGGFEVIVTGRMDQTKTIVLRNVTSIAAIDALVPSVIAVSGPDGAVSRVYLLPEGEAVAGPPTVRQGDADRPFQFTFDPSAAPLPASE